jgi:hypothetical protein
MADVGGGGGGKSSRASAGRVTSRARAAGAGGGGSVLMLASMLDILMAILFFLLKNYSTVVSDFSMGKDIALPSSSALNPPTPALQLVVTKSAIMLDDKEICAIVNGDISRKDLHSDGVTIVKLAQALNEQRTKSEFFRRANSDDPKKEAEKSFAGTIVMQADKSLQFNLLKKVIYTAGITDFVMLKLAVIKKEEGA